MSDKRKSRQSPQKGIKFNPHGKNEPEMKSPEETAPEETSPQKLFKETPETALEKASAKKAAAKVAPKKKAEKTAPIKKTPLKKEGNFGVSGSGKFEGVKVDDDAEYITVSSSDEEDIEQPKDLPPFWKAYKHESGVVVYLHKPSRICSLSKPFYATLDDSALEISLPGAFSYMASASSAEVKKEDSSNIDKTKKAK